MNSLVFESELLSLRAIEPEDLDLMHRWENNPEIWQVSNTLAPYSRYTIRQYLENCHQDIFTTKQIRFVIDDKEKKSLGFIDLFDFDPFHSRAGVGILIASSTDRQKGYALEALQLLSKYAFDHLCLHQLYAQVGALNSASIRLFEKAGFVKCGTKKQWLKTGKEWEDELTFQLISTEK